MCKYNLRKSMKVGRIHSAGWNSSFMSLGAMGHMSIWIRRSMSTHRLHPKRLLACICRYRCGSSTKTAPGRFLVSSVSITVLSFLLYLHWVTRYRIQYWWKKNINPACLFDSFMLRSIPPTTGIHLNPGCTSMAAPSLEIS